MCEDMCFPVRPLHKIPAPSALSLPLLPTPDPTPHAPPSLLVGRGSQIGCHMTVSQQEKDQE